MDLGCIDMGCLEKRNNEAAVLDSETKSAKQNKATREAAQPSLGALNKFTSQIKKPPHRKGSPINWFPRKKMDSFLKRKIKLLQQEVGGMNSTLDETLGDANPHYSKVLKEKMAVREAAQKAKETRKAAMVEASWCRILQAARIHNKDAEALLLEADKTATEAFEAAKAIGVIMYDMPDCPQKQYEIETSIVNGGRLASHTVTAAFETAFEVDKQVAAAVKAAFIKLASCPSINKEEFKELLGKISENPGGEDFHDVPELSSECESDTGSEFETGCDTLTKSKSRKHNKKQVFEKFNMAKLVDMMLERLRHLQEDELASLATIVATCGLSAALAEAENEKQPGLRSSSDHHHTNSRRVSSFGVYKSKRIEPELPSLDKFLVKRLTRLEKEVQEAKDARVKENLENTNATVKVKNLNSAESDSDLGSVLVKHLSKLEREVQEAKSRRNIEHGGDGTADSVTRTQIQNETFLPCDGKPVDKENIDLNKNSKKEIETRSLDEILVKPVHRLEKEKIQATSLENEYASKHYEDRRKDASAEEWESLDKVLVKHVSRLEKEKIESQEPLVKVKRKELGGDGQGSLDQILVKHKSRLEKEKVAFAEKTGDEAKHVISRKEMRERELQEAWGGLSLGNSIRPHLSRLQRDKAAWLNAEEEEKRKHMKEEERVL